MDDPLPPEDAATVRHEQTIPSERSLIVDIEVRYPGWGAWRSDTLRWWAFRTAAAALTIEQLRAGCRLIVRADSHGELCAEVLAEIERADAVARQGDTEARPPGCARRPSPVRRALA